MKTILLVYYNINIHNFYFKQVNGIDLLISNKHLGFANCYGHVIISILLIDNNKIIPISCYDDYVDYFKEKYTDRKSLINDLIDNVIRLLNRFKK